MKIKRVLQGTALTALAAAAWMGAGSADASAAISVDDISYDNQSLDIISSGAKEIIVGIAKVDKNNKAKVSAWDVYEGSSAWVDLSKVNVTKEAYIAVKTDTDEIPVFVKIDAAEKKNKAELNAGTRKITFTSGGTETAGFDGNYDGDKEYDDNGKIVSQYIAPEQQYLGDTLYLSVPGREYFGEDKKIGEITDVTDDKKDGKKATLVTIGKFPTKSVKLNVPKQANGPAVPVDYVKGTIKIKKGVELRVVGNVKISNIASGAAFDNKTLSVSQFFDAQFENANEDKGTLEVRVAAKTEGKKGKAASKWTRVAIQKPQDISGTTGVESGATVATSGAAKATVSGGAVELTYTSAKKTGAADGGLKFDNKSTYNIDYVVGTETAAPVPNEKGVVTGSKTVKAGKATTLKKLSDNQVVWVRVSGDKNKKQWATAWAPLHKVILPK